MGARAGARAESSKLWGAEAGARARGVGAESMSRKTGAEAEAENTVADEEPRCSCVMTVWTGAGTWAEERFMAEDFRIRTNLVDAFGLQRK